MRASPACRTAYPPHARQLGPSVASNSEPADRRNVPSPNKSHVPHIGAQYDPLLAGYEKAQRPAGCTSSSAGLRQLRTDIPASSAASELPSVAGPVRAQSARTGTVTDQV